MRADQFEKKERQLRAALAETTARLGRTLCQPGGAGRRRRLPAELAQQRGTQKQLATRGGGRVRDAVPLPAPARTRGLGRRCQLRDEQLGVVLAGFRRRGRRACHRRDGFHQAGQEERGRQAPVLRGLGQDRQLPGGRVPLLADGQGPRADRPRALPARGVGRGCKNAAGRRVFPEEVEFATKPALARAPGRTRVWRPVHARRGWWPTPCTGPTTSCVRLWKKPGSPMSWRSPASSACGWALANGASRPSRPRCPPTRGWRLSVAAGTKGPRVFDWVALTINHPHGKAWQRFLLLRRSRSKSRGDHRLPGLWSGGHSS